MFSEKKRTVLVRCEDCQMLLSVDLENDDDIEKMNDNELELDCVCGGQCAALRD